MDFLDPIRKRNLNIKDSKVLLLGAGGAARAITAGFAKEKAESITIANRTKQNANTIVQFANKIGIKANSLTLDEVGESASNYDFIVNATSVGLKNESSPISTKSINQDSIVYDIVYMPMNTDSNKTIQKKWSYCNLWI